MSKFGLFPVLLITVYCPLLLIALSLVYYFSGWATFSAFFWGSLTSLILIGATTMMAGRMLTGKVSLMLAFVFGGFTLRFLIVLGCGVFVFFLTKLSLITYFMGLLSSYIVLQVIEIVHLQKQLTKQVTKSNERLD